MRLSGCRATVMGLGHFGGGVAAARWLAAQGATVVVTDQSDAETLAESLAQLAHVPIARYQLGGHLEADFRDIDLLVVNPAVKPDDRFVQVARQSGARITTELELFIEHCPATMVGVTGSNGKSTTAAMIDAILRSAGRTSWLGGNVGGSLLNQLGVIRAGDCVVLEMSSFQLWRLAPTTRMPHVAVVTSFSPNHLDWHGSRNNYRNAKQKILSGQTRDDLAVLNAHDSHVARWASKVRGTRVPLPPLATLPELRVPGRHNQTNAACAAAAAAAMGCSPGAIGQALSQFSGLPGRAEYVASICDIEFYDDSSATTPESTIAAIWSLPRPIWLVAGGLDKGLDYGPLTTAIARRCRGASFYGAMREQLRRSAARGCAFPCNAVDGLPEAFTWCWRHARPGDAIVLSPACSSHDQFLNYRHRSEVYRSLVASLEKNGRTPIDRP